MASTIASGGAGGAGGVGEEDHENIYVIPRKPCGCSVYNKCACYINGQPDSRKPCKCGVQITCNCYKNGDRTKLPHKAAGGAFW